MDCTGICVGNVAFLFKFFFQNYITSEDKFVKLGIHALQNKVFRYNDGSSAVFKYCLTVTIFFLQIIKQFCLDGRKIVQITLIAKAILHLKVVLCFGLIICWMMFLVVALLDMLAKQMCNFCVFFPQVLIFFLTISDIGSK